MIAHHLRDSLNIDGIFTVVCSVLAVCILAGFALLIGAVLFGVLR